MLAIIVHQTKYGTPYEPWTEYQWFLCASRARGNRLEKYDADHALGESTTMFREKPVCIADAERMINLLDGARVKLIIEDS